MVNGKFAIDRITDLKTHRGKSWDRREFVKGMTALAGSAGLLGYDMQPTAAEPTPTPASASQKPKKKGPTPAAAAPSDDVANPFAVPPDDSLQKRFTRRSKMPWIIFGCFFVILLLGCAGGCGYGLWYKFKDNISEAIGKEKK